MINGTVTNTTHSTTNSTHGGIDGTIDWLPPGPVAVKPEYPVIYMNVPEAALTLSNYIKTIGWTLDGASSAKQGNEHAVELWWAEIAKE